MKPDGKNTLIKSVYNTFDIVHVTCNTYNKYWNQCRELAQTLAGNTEIETCRNIWQFCNDNIQYREDPAGVQLVKTPARLVDDGFGDCKSIAILCAACLSNLGIKCKFRFVSFGSKDVRHVYVVTESGINIDPVEWMQNGKQFNEVSNYKYKMDKPIKNGLAVLSGVGATTNIYDVWMGESQFITNTLALNYIYTAIDLQFALINADGNDIEVLNQCDRLTVALVLYKRATGFKDLLQRSAAIIQQLEDDGFFSETSINDDLRAEHLEKVVNRALDMLASDRVITAAGAFYNWFMLEIANQDFSASSEQDIELYNNWLGDAVGATTTNELLAKMKESAPYFLYLFFTDAQIAKYKNKAPKLATRRQVERNIYDSWVRNFTSLNLSQSQINNILLSGCVARLGTTPEKWFDYQLKTNGKIGTIGVDAIVAICIAVLTVLVAILDLVKSVIQKKTADVETEIAKLNAYPEGTPQSSDLSGIINDGAGTNTTTTTGVFTSKMPLLAAAGAILLFKLK